MTDEQDDLLVKVGLGLALTFFVIIPLAKKLGLDGGADKDISDIESLDPTQNPFSIHFGDDNGLLNAYGCNYMASLKQSLTSQMSSFSSGTGIVSLLSFGMVQAYTQDYGVDYGGTPLDIAIAGENIKEAFDSMHNLNIDAVVAAFNNLLTQADVAKVARYLNCNYNMDLWTMLNHGSGGLFGSWGDGLASTSLKQIIDNVKNLPYS